MKPIRLEVENLRSFRTRRVIDFDGLEIVAILGDTGAGKTSILEAITYALFNRSTWSGRNVKELITRGSSTMTVVFTFSVDSIEYQIVRVTKARGQSLHRLTCGEHGIDVSGEADVQQAVRDALHLDDTAFLHTVLLPQDKHAELLTKDQRERNRILSELFRLDDLAKVSDLARIHESRADVGLGALRRQREQYGEDPAGSVLIAENALRAAQEVLARADAAVQTVRSIDHQLAECNKTIDAHSQRLQILEPIAGQLHALEALNVAEQRLAPQIQELERSRAQTQVEKNAAESEAERLRVAGRDVTTLRHVKQDLEGLNLELREMQVERKRATESEAKIKDAADRMHSAKIAVEAAEKKYAEAEGACNRATDLLREDNARVNALESALSDERNSLNRRDVLATRRDLTKQRVQSLQLEVEKACGLTTQAKCEYDEAVRAREQAQVAEQAASCAQHLHAGDDCPICHRTLPKGFEPPEVPAVKKAQENELQANAAYQVAARNENTLRGQLTGETNSLADDERQLEDAGEEYSAAAACVRTLLSPPDSDAQQVLQMHKSRAASTEKELPALRAAVGECNIQLATIREQHVTAQTDHRNHSATLKELEGSVSTRLSRCEDLCRSIPAPVRPKMESESVAEALRSVDQMIESAESVEMRIATGAQALTDAVSKLAELNERLTREVFLPRAGVYAQITAIARLLECAVLPEDDKKRAKWAQDVERAAKAEQDRLAREVDSIRLCVDEFFRKRAEIVGQVGGEPREVASEALLRRRDAEHTLEDARKRVVDAAAIEQKIARLEPVKMGLGSLRDALGAREFPAYATQQRQRRLLEEATLIFREMTDNRYGFTEDFEIFDSETNDARSPHTLSGGEKFLASLALSLAVVEIASNAGAKIEALFLDEGFASLDAATLEQAMLELRKRSRAGRMICVISHLSQVTEFVNDTILVQETADGSEICRQSGPIDDDASVVEGLVSHLAPQAM